MNITLESHKITSKDLVRCIFSTFPTLGAVNVNANVNTPRMWSVKSHIFTRSSLTLKGQIYLDLLVHLASKLPQMSPGGFSHY